MKIYILLLTFLVSGCASNVWVGSNPQKDMAECELEAASKYAPALYTEQVGPGYKSPTYTYCNSFSGTVTCNSMGGQYTPPTSVTFDANSSTRKKYINYCMNQRGNRLMSTSDYEAEKEALAVRQATAKQPEKQHSAAKQVNLSNETPEARITRLREECRSKNGRNSPLKACL